LGKKISTLKWRDDLGSFSSKHEKCPIGKGYCEIYLASIDYSSRCEYFKTKMVKKYFIKEICNYANSISFIKDT